MLPDVQGSKMYINLKDKGLSVDLLLDRVREPHSTQFLSTLLRKGDSILDIGANIGYYALLEARLVGREGKVFALEPSPASFVILKKNIEVNAYAHIHVFPVAAADKEGSCEMCLYEQANLNSMLERRDRNVLQRICVPTVTVDGFLADKEVPRLIRMDVEGYEDRILQGMAGTLQDPRLELLFIELHPHIMGAEKTRAVLEVLKAHRFEIMRNFQSEGSNLRWALDKKLHRVSGQGAVPQTVEEFLSHDEMITGQRGAFEIFFRRKDG